MIYLTIALCLVLAASALLVKALLDERGRAEKAWTRERQVLLNRIKPETAQPVGDEPETTLPAVGWDDDDDFYAAQAGMSKEELADRAFADEIAS